MMFSVFCPTHDAEILMTRRNTLGFWNGPEGSVIRWRCNCGHEGFLDRNGSHPDPVDQRPHEQSRRHGPCGSDPLHHAEPLLDVAV